MAYDQIPVIVSDRDGSNADTPVTGVAGNGLKINNTTGDVIVFVHNDSGSPIVLSQTNAPNIEAVVDGMVVSNKPVASIANGESAVLGPWLNSEYGNDDPDGGSIPDGKAVLITYTSGDGGLFVAARRGSA